MNEEDDHVTPRKLGDDLVKDAAVIPHDTPIPAAVRRVLESGLPALPIVDDDERLCGIFGEREFMTALFPGYVRELSYAAFVPSTLDAAIDKRAACRSESVSAHMNTEHVDVPTDFSDLQVAETFLHHRVLIIPVTDHGHVTGVITRSEFFEQLARHFLETHADEKS